VRPRRLRIAVAAIAIAIGASGCASSSYDTAHQKKGGPLAGHEVADNNNDGTYVSAGPITYQMEISRELNPYGAEDSQYLKGLPKGMSPTGLAPDELWYGVFLWAKDQHHAAHWTSDRFEITDTLGRIYRPVKLDAAVNPFAWTSRKLVYGETEPSQDSPAAQYFSGGKLVLFKLNSSIYSNRPLTLYILSPTGKRIGEISLDL
jgi:hypothetical protein